MLRKGDNFMNPHPHPRKPKTPTDANESCSELNKENRAFKSVYEHEDDHKNRSELSACGSMMVSPTFQSAHVVSLKDDLFRQDHPKYLSIGFSLKDMDKPTLEKQPTRPADRPLPDREDDKYRSLLREYEQLKGKLTEHYQSKRYWKKIEKLFEQEDVDAVLAWQDSIDKYQTVKNEASKQEGEIARLTAEVGAREERIGQFERQAAQDKNETRVLSQKKCKECEHLKQKEKEHFELTERYKKLAKTQEESSDRCLVVGEQLKKLEEKYNDLTFLNEELQKKNIKLVEREKELAGKLQTLQNEELKERSKLHIEIEQLKEAKYQTDKTFSKLEEKYRRDLKEANDQLHELQQENHIYQAEADKLRTELTEVRPKLIKAEIELANIDSSLRIKRNECEDLKRKHVEDMTEEVTGKNQLHSLLKNKEDELARAYELIDQAENIRQKLEAELKQLRKSSDEKEEENCRYAELLKELETRCKQLQENEQRFKDNNQFFNLAKTKNPNSTSQNTQPRPENQPNALSRKILAKIRQIYQSIRLNNEDSLDSYPRRKQDEGEEANLPQAERYINEIGSELASMVNRYEYVRKDNEILKEQLENELKYKEQEMGTLRREVNLKEEALKCIAGFVPDELKDAVLEFLFVTERLSTDDHHEELEIEEYEELRYSLENDSREWKENQARREKRARQLEEEVRRLEEEGREMGRRLRGKEGKEGKKVATDYDYREAVSKKDIRRKYQL